MDWRQFLLHNVTEIPRIGIPGRVVVFGEKAAPILTGTTPDEILIAAATYGKGRVIVISHDGYARGLENPAADSVNPSIQTLHSNIRHWLTGSQQASRGDIVLLNHRSLNKDSLKNARMVIWAGGNMGRVRSTDILAYVHGGGGFVRAMNPWGWLQINTGMLLEEMPFWDALVEIGLFYSNHDTINQSSGTFRIADNKAVDYTNLSEKRHWRSTLINALTELQVIGTPGLIKVFGRNSGQIITGNKVDEVFMAAARYGQGHVVAFSHDSYTRDLERPDHRSADPALTQLYGNIFEWMTGGRTIRSYDLVRLNNPNLTLANLRAAKIAIWDHGEKGRISSDDLIDYIRQGGGFIHAAAPIGWIQMNPGKTLVKLPYHDVLKRMGLCYSGEGNMSQQPDGKFHIDSNEALIERVLQARLAWKDDLLQDISVLPQLGYPGGIVVFGINAEPILTSTSPENVLIAAAEYGQGRIIAISQSAYAENMEKQNPPAIDPAVQKLRYNIVNWLTAVEDCDRESVENNRVVRLSGANVTVENLRFAKVAMWNGGVEARVTSDDLLYFIRRGGSFIHAATPWGWLGANPGKTLQQMPYYDVLLTAGMAYTKKDVMPSTANKEFQISQNKSDVAHVMRHIRKNCKNLAKLFEYADLMKMIRYIPLSIIEDDVVNTMRSLFDTLTEHVRTILPSKENPTTNIQQVNTMNMWLTVQSFLDLKNIVAPGCELFPGNFETLPTQITHQLRVACDYKEIFSTGVYLPAGQTLQVEVLSGNTNQNWRIQIGAHTDILKIEKIPRWPKIYVKEDLTMTYHNFNSPFGGLVYLLSPEEANSHLEIKLTGAVTAPVFQLSDGGEAVDLWRSRRNASGLWADIIGRYITITLPSSSIRELDDPTPATMFWDQLVRNYHELRGTDVTKSPRQWIVTDIKPSAGYMHSGYPIVTHLDVSDPTKKKFLLSSTPLQRDDNWGIFHEIGHNMTRNEWTYQGSGEVTCNIFTLYAMDVMCNQRPWIHSWMSGYLSQAISYLTEGADFAKWKKSPGVGVFIYAQMARDFGWESYRSVLRRYEQMEESQKPKQDQDEIDRWFEIFSEACNRNLTALVKFWGIPLTAESQQRMGRFQNYLPDDELTRAVPSRTDSILQEYPGADRPSSSASR